MVWRSSPVRLPSSGWTAVIPRSAEKVTRTLLPLSESSAASARVSGCRAIFSPRTEHRLGGAVRVDHHDPFFGAQRTEAGEDWLIDRGELDWRRDDGGENLEAAKLVELHEERCPAAPQCSMRREARSSKA